MKKPLIVIALVAAVVALILVLRGGDDDGYQIRAVFDNGSFLVKGEEVRVAGATVGTIKSVGVTMPGEMVSFKDGRWREAPGKAVMVLNIDDPGFQDFRQDATCLIRPQSLIGEKFIDCRPTRPRAPGSEIPPALKVIPDGEPGAGQHILPLEQNSTSVDPDLINNINRLPYVQRFRLILNELGISLAGRGEDIEETVKRANPALRDLTHLIGMLRDQRDDLVQLAVNGEEIMRPFAGSADSVAGFFSNAGAAAEASSEKGEALEASLRKLPGFLSKFKSTLVDLKGFSDAAQPVFSNLDQASPALAEATKTLTPFFAASTVSLKSLGATGEVAGPNFAAADPVVKKARDLAITGAVPISQLARLLVTTKRTSGFYGLTHLIYNGAAATNEYDKYGHFLRSMVEIVDCAGYFPGGGKSSCSANFTGAYADEGEDELAHLQSLERHIEELMREEEAEGQIEAGGLTAPAGPDLGNAEAPSGSSVPEPEDETEVEPTDADDTLREELLRYVFRR